MVGRLQPAGQFFHSSVFGLRRKSGQEYLRGPGLWVADTSIFRNFNLTERFHLQFRAEAFNVLNHTNFLIGNNTGLHNPEFGAAAGTSPPRNLQFGLKLSF